MWPQRRRLEASSRWIYYGKEGYAAQIDRAFDTAAYMAQNFSNHPNLKLVSTNPPPCMRVCFYYAPRGKLCPEAEGNSRAPADIAARLVREGFVTDYAPGENCKFFRVCDQQGETRRDCGWFAKGHRHRGKERFGADTSRCCIDCKHRMSHRCIGRDPRIVYASNSADRE